MKELADWYWNFGIQRGYDMNDPDHEARKVSIGNWLDPVEQIIRRGAAIRANATGRGCIALWGPSQTGKSTLLSRYIDGERADGRDSAMTWDESRPVRFSPLFGQDLPSGTLVFNPYHQGSDASGVATRYTLGKDGEVDAAYPVEMKLASNAQVVNALSLGYLSDCQSVAGTAGYTVETFLERITPECVDHKPPTRSGYEILRDIADVVQLMRSNDRFKLLFFRKGEWESKVRPALVSSPTLLSDPESARAFLEEAFWESAKAISEVSREMAAVRERLTPVWAGRRIFLSQEAAALMLDIDSYRSFTNPASAHGEETADKVRRLRWRADEERIVVEVGSGVGSPEISGAAFGYFQALCGELIVPLKAENLAGDAKAPFRTLLEKCDILDLPGLSHVNKGSNGGGENSSRLDLEKADPVQILTRIFKEGKTQSLVHGHALGYGLDAFVILCRADGKSPSKSDLIGEGVGEWLKSFDPGWQPSQQCEMPVFIDLTFFSQVVNSVTANRGVGDGLAPVANAIMENMAFCKPGTCKWFATNYHQIPSSAITSPESSAFAIDAISGDEHFMNATYMRRDDIAALFETDGGTGRMFARIADTVSPAKRTGKCKNVLAADRAALLALIRKQLPGEDSEGVMRQRLAHFRSEIERRVAEAEESEDFEGIYLDMSCALKAIFSASPEMFEPVPLNFGGLPKKKSVDYVRRQAVRWFDAKQAFCRGINGFEDEDVAALLSALRDSVDAVSIARTLHGPGFGELADGMTARAARFPLAQMFSNQFLRGSTTSERRDENDADAQPEAILNRLLSAAAKGSRQRGVSPAYIMVIGPALERISEIERDFTARSRPSQPGDDELAAILAEIEGATQA